MREQRAQHDRNDQNASNQQRHEQPRPADDQNNGVNIDINTLVTRISDEILRRVDSRATNQPQPPQDRNIQITKCLCTKIQIKQVNKNLMLI